MNAAITQQSVPEGTPIGRIKVPYRPACRLTAGGARFEGYLERLDAQRWTICGLGPTNLIELRGSRVLGITLHSDIWLERRMSAPSFRLTDFTFDDTNQRIIFRCPDLLARGAKPAALGEALPALLSTPCLFRRVLNAKVAMVSPFELVVSVVDAEELLVPGTMLTIVVLRPWGGRFRLIARLYDRSEVNQGESHIVLRPIGRQAVLAAARLALCESSSFGILQLRRHHLSTQRIARYLSVTRAYSTDEFAAVMRLRRAANQLFGRRGDAHADEAWQDRLDASSISILVRLGSKPVGTGRLVFNDKIRGMSEIEAEVPLPEWVWSERFAEVSRVAIDPDNRGAGVMIALFQEIGRVALEMNCRYLLLDAIEELVPIYERIGAEKLPLTKKHPFSDERVYIMVIDVRNSLSRIDSRLLYWLYVFGPAVRSHLRIFGSVRTRGISAASIGFAIKRIMTYAVRF